MTNFLRTVDSLLGYDFNIIHHIGDFEEYHAYLTWPLRSCDDVRVYMIRLYYHQVVLVCKCDKPPRSVGLFCYILVIANLITCPDGYEAVETATNMNSTKKPRL